MKMTDILANRKKHSSRKTVSLLLVLLFTAAVLIPGSSSLVFAGDSESRETELTEEDSGTQPGQNDVPVKVRVGAMSGPTAMGLVKLMEDSSLGDTENTYEFGELLTEASAFVTPLAKGEIDIAAVPSNLASVLYNKTGGGVQVIAVSVLSVLNIAERGDEIHSIPDLKGRTLYATGQGATPEYVLRYLLTENGLDPEKDLTISWCADTTEAAARLASDETAAAMLPQPFATAACAKTEGLHLALDLGEEWSKISDSSQVVTGVMVVRTAFAKEHPEEVQTFLKEYQDSVRYTAEDPKKTAALIEKYGIVGSAAIAEKALPECHLVCLTGEEREKVLSGYLGILYGMDPASVGGTLPGEDFYY